MAQSSALTTAASDVLKAAIYSFIIRPPDIVVGGLIFYRGFFFLSFRQLSAELAERSSTIFSHMVGSKCNLKMHVQNLGYLLPLQIGSPKATFLDDFATQWEFNGL